MKRIGIIWAIVASVASCWSGGGKALGAGPALSIDVLTERHPISPYIYGMAYPDHGLEKEIQLPMVRWGGDSTTRYNWKIDRSNSGDDWFFMAGGDKAHPTPSGEADAMIAAARQAQGAALITIPIIDYINKAVATDCSYPVSLFGKQEKTNPYVHPLIDGKQTDAGNGKTPDGKNIVLTRQQILRIHTPNTPEYQRAWVQHLVQTFGTAKAGGVAAYELDNEPGGWGNTHRDVHPGPPGHAELASRAIAYAAMIKSVDPTAIVVGPGDFLNNAQNDGIPGDGRKEHGDLGQGDYFLEQFAAYEKQHGKRILDWYDQHFYPTAQDGQNDDTVLESTRSLWDPTYKENNWIGKWRGAINLIPGFKASVEKHYPGTKVSISEYGYGDMNTVTGALVEADVLGIFARENLAMACMFGPPKAGQPGANAFRAYLNFDGQGGRFGETWVSSKSENQSVLAVYAAERKKDHSLTAVVINKLHDEVTTDLTLTGFKAGKRASVYRFDEQAPTFVKSDAVTVDATGVHASYPGRSITVMVIPHE